MVAKLQLHNLLTLRAPYRHPDEANGRRLWALVTVVDGGARFNARVVDDAGEVYVSLNGYRTVQLPGNVSL